MEVKLSPIESSPLSSSPPLSGDDGGDLVIVGGRRVGGELVDREAKVRCLLTRSRSHLLAALSRALWCCMNRGPGHALE